MATTFRIKERPHFEVGSRALAAWLLEQGAHRWWSVDGDPILSALIAMPCTAEELAEHLNRIDKPLLVYDAKERPDSRGRILKASELDDVLLLLRDNENIREGGPAWLDNRFLTLSWKNHDEPWLLIEDLETTQDYATDLREQEGSS